MSLTERRPQLDVATIVSSLVPPPHFAQTTFETYAPDLLYPSQTAALTRTQQFVAELNRRRRWRRRRDTTAPHLYLDGGFGVGKTHLLASIWHSTQVPAAYGTFVEYTNLVGAMGFAPTIAALASKNAVLIDEFELDDPGDTVMMARMLRELDDAGVKVVATSNTLPEALGEGRFAAVDFQREIQAMAARFETVRIEGVDYRHRGADFSGERWSQAAVSRWAHEHAGALDVFSHVMTHLREVHPSRYGMLLDGVRHVGWTEVHAVTDQSVALRLVVLVDRLYDRTIPVRWEGVSLSGLFAPELMQGGYRKKYYRAQSRLAELLELD